MLGWGICPPPPNVTLNTDELKASAYRCKKERSVAFNVSGQGCPLPSLVGWVEDTPPQDSFAFGARHTAPRFCGDIASIFFV